MVAFVFVAIGVVLERVKGIEPSYEAWEAAVLPLNYTRTAADFKQPAPACGGQCRA
jgi:hypothetical protein